ncbi:MAG: class I SAM-dependent methyltransferase [Geminicoccales bacterium]
MIDWQDYWDKKPRLLGETEFLKQVGRTSKGKPVSDEQIDLLVSTLFQGLELASTDTVMDLCCGNGLITYKFAQSCRKVFGVDYSIPLMEVAKKHHSLPNIQYIQSSVLEIDPSKFAGDDVIDKVAMTDALQHFETTQFRTILTKISMGLADKGIVFFSGVPDKSRMDNFLDRSGSLAPGSEKRDAARNAIGSWWDRAFITETADDMGYRCQILDQHNDLLTSHYRFDIRLEKSTPS